MENMYSIKSVTKVVASLILVVMQSLVCCMQTNSGDTTVSLLQGSKGIVPCTKYQIQQSDGIWWYFGTFDNDGLIISKFNQYIKPADGIPTGTYGIDKELSLVITNVSLSNEGMYYYLIRPSQTMNKKSGLIMVEVKDNHIFLERGQSVTVPYFPVLFNHYSLREEDFVYWRFKAMMDTGKPGLLVTCHFKNGTAHKTYPKSPRTEIYQVDRICSLVIVNVTDSDEGKYFYELWSKFSSVPDWQIRAEVKVTPIKLYPVVQGCRDYSEPTACEVELPSNTVLNKLTCVFYYAKPAVDIKWLIVLHDGRIEHKHVNSTVKKTVLPGTSTKADRFKINNTYTTSASIQLQLSRDDVRAYRCEAYGVALGDKTGNNVTVTIRFLPPITTDFTPEDNSNGRHRTPKDGPPDTPFIWYFLTILFFFLFTFVVIVIIFYIVKNLARRPTFIERIKMIWQRIKMIWQRIKMIWQRPNNQI